MDAVFTANELYYLHVKNGEYRLAEDTPADIADSILTKLKLQEEERTLLWQS